MINCDGKGNDMFVPLKFEIRTRFGTTDIFRQAFGYDRFAPYLEDEWEVEGAGAIIQVRKEPLGEERTTASPPQQASKPFYYTIDPNMFDHHVWELIHQSK